MTSESEEPAVDLAAIDARLANQGFIAKAPADVVDAERSKLEAYRAELEELGG